MASQNLRLLSLGFMLFVLCLYNCSARKVLMEELIKEEKAQPKADMKPAPMPESGHKLGQNINTKPNQGGEIDLESCGDGCCEGGCCEGGCCEGGCCGGGCETGHWVPTPPLVSPQAPHLVPTPPLYTPQAPQMVMVPTPPLVMPRAPHLVPTPPIITPEPPTWVEYPSPCTPCETWNGPGPCPCPCEEGSKTESNNNEKEDGEKMHASGVNKMEDGAPSSSSTAEAPMAAMMDGSNVRA